VRVLTLDEKNARYDVVLSDHAHFICRICSAIHDFLDLKPEAFQLPESKYFKIEVAEISYIGVCGKCRNTN